MIVAAGLFWLVFSNLRGFYDLIVEFLNIIAALLYGCLFAYLMNPVMKVTQRIMDKLLAKRNISDRMAARISKITGICVAVLVVCLAVYALIALIVPNLIGTINFLMWRIITGLTVARERELGTFDQMLVSPASPVEIACGKLIPGCVVGLVHGTIIYYSIIGLIKMPIVWSVTEL